MDGCKNIKTVFAALVMATPAGLWVRAARANHVHFKAPVPLGLAFMGREPSLFPVQAIGGGLGTPAELTRFRYGEKR